MTAKKLNCWEEKGCQCGPDGALARERGVCPAASATTCDGMNGGINAGRFCWAIDGTLCDGQVQGTLEEKVLGICQDCSFFRQVKYEEGAHLQLLKPGLRTTDTRELHRLLNNVVTLTGICRDIFGCLAVKPLLERIAKDAHAVTGATSVAAYLVDGSGDCMTLVGNAGRVGRPERVSLSEADPVAEAARTGRLCQGSAVLPDLQEPAVAAAVPVSGAQDVAGALEFVKPAGEFSTDDEWFLREFGLIASLGIGNAQHIENLQQLKRFDKSKSKFVAVLMHHISSPLATIACSLQAIAQLGESLSDEDTKELIRHSLDRINAIQQLSRKLLDLAAIRSGAALGDVRPVHPIESLRQEIEVRQVQAQEKGVELVVTDHGEGVSVLADPAGLRLVFGNLIGNAIKYSREDGGRVDVDLATGQGMVRVTIRDRGIGIPAEEQERIFEEFHRASNVTEAGASGFGVGLTVVREFVDRYEGHLALESEVGVGTTVCVSFPAVADINSASSA